jgi:catechol 2,3-dioxygenase-like lactoylglutathione lyase family enzyme
LISAHAGADGNHVASTDRFFNHIGLCVTDLARSRDFYVNALGFVPWFALTADQLPEKETAQVLELDTPLGMEVEYLVRDGLVLELLAFHPDRYEPWRRRSFAEPGLTHISMSVDDVAVAIEDVERHGGSAVPGANLGNGAMVRDPDGQLIELLEHAFRDSRPPFPE